MVTPAGFRCYKQAATGLSEVISASGSAIVDGLIATTFAHSEKPLPPGGAGDPEEGSNSLRQGERSVEMSLRLIEAERAEHPVSLLCSVVSVTRGGHHAWRSRGRSARELCDGELAARSGASSTPRAVPRGRGGFRPSSPATTASGRPQAMRGALRWPKAGDDGCG